ncbi:DNA methyltransferase [Clostridia bacterium]|nr:DNA methyltransferase [Clostridia bacterium]
MSATPKSPISRVGGKYYLAPKLIKLIPAHTTYVEPFGGAMHVLFAKSPSRIELYNDIEDNLVNFFQVVKSEFDALERELEFTLYSRSIFDKAKANLNKGSPVSRAANFYIVNKQCFGGKMGTWGRQISAKRMSNINIDTLRKASERLKDVQVDCSDFRKVISDFDTKNTLFYCDPPYMFNGVRGNTKSYKNELTNADHADLLNLLKGIKGKFILSGYDNELYNKNFERVIIGESNMCIKKKKNGVPRPKKMEYVWTNFKV